MGWGSANMLTTTFSLNSTSSEEEEHDSRAMLPTPTAAIHVNTFFIFLRFQILLFLLNERRRESLHHGLLKKNNNIEAIGTPQFTMHNSYFFIYHFSFFIYKNPDILVSLFDLDLESKSLSWRNYHEFYEKSP
jgi:hypothetical protein